MRILVNIARIITGVLFIFSGLIKANDPLGLSYKMQEFFEVWAQNPWLHKLMLWLNNYALSFSILMITLEIIVGVAILLGWNKRFFSWLLLLLMIFFTFLTAYAVFSGKIRTCGCFGDCIPLTAMQSFIKDIILLVLVLIIFFGIKYITPSFRRPVGFNVIAISVALVLGFQWYVLRYQPVMDCLPFKKGNNLLEFRKMPSNAIPDKIDFTFVYEKNGKQKNFNKNEIPDSTWTFVKREDIIIKKGENNEPPIKDFFIMTISGADTTEAMLNDTDYYYLFLIRDFKKGTDHWLNNFTNLYTFAREKNRPVYVIASQGTVADQFFNQTNNFNVRVFSCDDTALKTAARTNPSLYLMHGPVVQDKWGWANLENALE